MKLEKTLSFFLLIAALVFCISCGGKGSKYDDLDDSDAVDNDSEKEDEDKPLPVTDEDGDTDDNGDTEVNDSDTDTDTDTVTDNDTDDTDTDSDNDADDTDTDSDNDADDTDTNSDKDADDTDTNSDEDDTDTDENPDIDMDIVDGKDDPGVICTGQTKCYNTYEEINCQSDSPFFGQDALYTSQGYCNDKSFSISTDKTVVEDNHTELIWQNTIPSSYEGCTNTSGTLCLHSEAIAYCEYLKSQNYAGHNDWRLPTPDELATIIDFGKTSPAIDSEIFKMPKTSYKEFWTQNALSPKKIWYIDFETGEIKSGEDKGRYVRCVSGELEKAEFSIMNADSEQKIVKDPVHNLFWTYTASEQSLSWQEALEHCQKLNYNGVHGWRLPSVNELATILDYSISKPASSFPSLEESSSPIFWTSTSYQQNIGTAWRISSSTGEVGASDKVDFIYKVLCVK